MPTIAQVEEQILTCEGFRVSLTPLSAKVKTLPSYDYLAMAPQKWRISDWKSARLGAYLTLLRDATVLRGDGAPAKRDLQLGNVRDSYYEEKYGSLAPAAVHLASEQPISLADEVSRRRRDPAPDAEPGKTRPTRRPGSS